MEELGGNKEQWWNANFLDTAQGDLEALYDESFLGLEEKELRLLQDRNIADSDDVIVLEPESMF